jgi:hypothetical protein
MTLLSKKRRWTAEDETVLKRLWLRHDQVRAAGALRRSVGAVRARAVKLGLIQPQVGRRRGRGSGIKTEVDGITFASKIEAAHYKTLLLRLKAGEIRDLRLQVRFPLFACPHVQDTKKVKVCDYIADFVYQENGEEVVEDTKPVRRRRKNGTLYADRATAVFKLKAKLFKANYAKDIQIVRL